MQTVMKAFNVRNRYKCAGDLGVEIEVEGDNLPHPEKYWRSEADGSLRGESREYVLEKPMTKAEVRKALAYLETCYQRNNTTVHDSIRAGVHVHVNVQELTVVQLFNFITTYIILEDLLVSFCGDSRGGNLFCLRIKDADYLLHELEEAATNKDYDRLDTGMLRYASMNVNSLFLYGSLEFRAMRGTRDLHLIELWANTLLNMREVSSTFANPVEIVNKLTEDGPESFLELFLGAFLAEVGNTLTGDKSLSDGLLRAYDLAMDTDWASFETKNIGGLDFPVDVEFPDVPIRDY